MPGEIVFTAYFADRLPIILKEEHSWPRAVEEAVTKHPENILDDVTTNWHSLTDEQALLNAEGIVDSVLDALNPNR